MVGDDVAVGHRTTGQLEAGIDEVRLSPADEGRLELIVRRPVSEEREVLEEASLSVEEGLVGDNWGQRTCSRTDDGAPHSDMQLNVINSRFLALIAGDPERMALAGDQLAVDLALGSDGLPPWTRIRIGEAVIQVTDQPHTGCAKFTRRFGLDAFHFLKTDVGQELNLRGICARVVVPGTIRSGDPVVVERPGA